MTNKDDPAPRSVLVQALILIGLTIALLFCIGVLAGFWSKAAEHGPGKTDYLIGGTLLTVAGLCGWQLLAQAPKLSRQASGGSAPSVRKSRNIWAFCFGLGLVLGVAAVLTSLGNGDPDPGNISERLMSDAPIDPAIALILLLGLALGTVASIMLYRTVDEHERAAQEYASLIAINFYVVLVFGWAIAAKGGLVAAVDNAIVFGAVMLSWIAAWIWRRYR